MKGIYLYGAGRHARVIVDSLISTGYSIKGLFYDISDAKDLKQYTPYGPFNIKILGSDELIIAIGDNQSRKRIVENLPKNILYGRAIHSSAIISSHATIGVGSVVMQGAIIQSGAKIANHCIVNTAASVDHDCIIEDYVHISPNATLCGGITVGEGSQVGAGAVIIPDIKIGRWSLVAAGAVVIKNVPDNVLVVGNPARIVKRLG